MNNRLKQLRRTLDLTQRVFAERIGTKQNTIATYEMGRNNPSDPVIHSICREFSVNEKWLRYGTGEMFIKKSTFSLDEYAATNRLTQREKDIIRRFMELEPDIRKAVYDIFKDEPDNVYNNAPDDPEELERKSPPLGDNDVSNIS